MADRPSQADRIVQSLGRQVEDALRNVIAPGQDVSLLDFPSYANPGDNAIWLGAVGSLARIGARLVYACEQAGYSRGILARRHRRGPILITGGGNLGDLWEAHQRFRERVLADFPDRPVVQLPQSICFRTSAALARARAAFDAHPDFTLLVRDGQSLAIARAEFRTPSLLCPDLAFALGPIPRPGRSARDVVWLSRRDKEAVGAPEAIAIPGLEPADYIARRAPAPERAFELAARFCPGRAALRRWTLETVHAALARRRLLEGCRFLSEGAVVVTNRLHGHILCLLMGIPHFVSDNSYGKLRSVYESWTRDSGLGVWCESEREAVELACRSAASIRSIARSQS